MNKTKSNYMWGNMDNIIQIIKSRVDLINRKTDLYDPKLISQDNDGCSHKSPHIFGDFMPMEKQHYNLYGFKSQCKSINERFSKLEGCLNSRRKYGSKTFPPLKNEL